MEGSLKVIMRTHRHKHTHFIAKKVNAKRRHSWVGGIISQEHFSLRRLRWGRDSPETQNRGDPHTHMQGLGDLT